MRNSRCQNGFPHKSFVYAYIISLLVWANLEQLTQNPHGYKRKQLVARLIIWESQQHQYRIGRHDGLPP